MKKSIFLLIILSMLFLPLAWSETAQLRGMQGNVQVLKKGTKEWQPGQQGMDLAAGDKVKTGEGSSATVETEKATLDLGEKTIFGIKEYSVKEDQMKSTFQLDLGKLKAKVQKMEKGSKLEVLTPTAVASVRGTIFDLWVFEFEGQLFTRLTVTEHSVIFCNADRSRCIEVSENEHSTAGGGGVTDASEFEVKDIPIDQAFDAQQGFDQEPPNAQDNTDDLFFPKGSSSDDSDSGGY